MLAVGRGLMDESIKLTRQEITTAYDAGRDAVMELVEGLIERYGQRIAALEQELQAGQSNEWDCSEVLASP